mgnify:CR=1 FL=1
MRSNHIRAVLVTAASLASVPAAAQDLGLVEGLFEEVSAVTVSYQLGGVPASDEITSDGLSGAGTAGTMTVNKLRPRLRRDSHAAQHGARLALGLTRARHSTTLRHRASLRGVHVL